MVKIDVKPPILIAIGILMMGCATMPEPKPIIKEVYVPVIQEPPEPPPFEAPVIPVTSLTDSDKDKPNVVVEAYAQSVRILMNSVQEAEKIIDSYRKKED